MCAHLHRDGDLAGAEHLHQLPVPDGGDVSVADLVDKGAVRDGQLVKVLGTGEIGVALRVSAHAFSGSARQKIEAAGGTATTL